MDLDTLGYGHLSPEGLNTLLLQAAGPDALEYEELTGTDVNLAVLDTLLLNGADIACRDSDGNSPLYRAVLHDQLREAEFLLEKGAPINDVYVNANDLDGETCLTTAVQLGNAQMVRMLLRCGADVNAIDGPGLVWFCA
ncbi:ankyrin repeat domain-containing protein 39 homolog [Paramacrobiotus metropolitanus]|uniref:ankyrin repeat domain-containing protein 39 homolog n=1 Tax=Paramacrobiotus metropolitanus TaxID=2943436 RepID=UPI002445841B|nr:ankyrin repeat domain-containing protein 39 homolog [Paramacrobiotus metropolitanus]